REVSRAHREAAGASGDGRADVGVGEGDRGAPVRRRRLLGTGAGIDEFLWCQVIALHQSLQALEIGTRAVARCACRVELRLKGRRIDEEQALTEPDRIA